MRKFIFHFEIHLVDFKSKPLIFYGQAKRNYFSFRETGKTPRQGISAYSFTKLLEYCLQFYRNFANFATNSAGDENMLKVWSPLINKSY